MCYTQFNTITKEDFPMKKLLSLILCLMLLLPVMAAAEAAAPVLPYTLDFGTFTMNVGANDRYEMAETMTSNQLYAIIYVDYDPNATITNSINVVWTSDDIGAEINMIGGMEKYAELVMQNAQTMYSSMGINMTDGVILMTEWADGIGCSVTSCNMDYSGAGVDLVTPLYQMQALFCNREDGDYIFTLTAASMEQLVSMASYLDTIQFK